MRYVENWLAVLGALTAMAYVLMVEIMPHSGMMACSVPPVHPGFPWGVATLVSVLVAPKTIGRATTGKIWVAVASRLPGGKKP